jgi:hypothetical protein
VSPQPADGEVHQRLGCEEMTFRVSDVARDPASRGQRKVPDDGEGSRWPGGHAFIREGAQGSSVVVMDLAPHRAAAAEHVVSWHDGNRNWRPALARVPPRRAPLRHGRLAPCQPAIVLIAVGIPRRLEEEDIVLLMPALLAPPRWPIVLGYAFGGALELPESGP